MKESNPTGQKQVASQIKDNKILKPVFSYGLLKQRAPQILLGQSFFNTLSLFIFRLSLTLFVSQRFGFSITELSELLISIGVINLLIRIVIFPFIIRKFGDEKTLIFGYSTLLSAFFWLIFMKNIWEFIAISILVSLGTTCSTDLMNGLMSKQVNQKDLGEMIGLNVAVGSISLILAPIIGSYLISLPNDSYFGTTTALTSILPILLFFVPLNKKTA